MIHILETELPNKSPVYIALRKIYGINKNNSFYICKKLGFSLNLKINELSNNQILKLIQIIEKSKIIINSELKKLKILNNKRLINIKSYRGLRKLKGFPVRGQRTRSNAITSKKLKNFL